MPETLLIASGIAKRFGTTVALEGVDFSVHAGEVLGLIGPNGSGKTTLFECLAGLMPADAGVVEMGGAALPAGDRKREMFYLPDGIRPWSDQRVEWLLEFFASMYDSGDAGELARALDIERLKRSRIGTLSKGEAKRTMLAIALLTPHRLLMLDEPFDGLDFRQTREVMNVLRARERTLFLSIHQLNDAARVCDRVVLLNRGRVAGEGSIEELRAQAGVSGGGLEEIFLALT